MRLMVNLLCAVLGFAAVTAVAQTYPTRPIRMLVGYPPGGSVDASARVVAERLGPLLGQTVLVENRAGATGNIAAEALTKAAARRLHTLFGRGSLRRSLCQRAARQPVRHRHEIRRRRSGR